MAMQIFVTTIKDNEYPHIYTLDVDVSDSIESLREKVTLVTGILTKYQILTYNDNVLQDGRTLADYGIPNEGTIQLSKIEEPEEKNKWSNMWMILLYPLFLLLALAIAIFKLW